MPRFFLLLPSKLREVDKIRHMLWSFWLTLAALILLPALQAFAMVFSIGLAKEIWDARYGSGFCLFDMVGNLLGIVTGLLCSFAFSGWILG